MSFRVARTRRRSLDVAALAIAALVLAPDVAAAGPDGLQVWTANLRKMNHQGNPELWKKFVDLVDSYRAKPDIIALTEICNNSYGGGPGNDVDEFLRKLERATGVLYEGRHAGRVGRPCTEANSMLVWRDRRFDLTRRNPLARWNVYTENPRDDDNKCTQNDGHNLRQIAVALRDKRQRRIVVASSVHVHVIDARKCINENAVYMDRVFEDLRRRRPLTIVAGDFNQPPQREKPRSGDEAAAGMEVDPACWYRSLSMLSVGDRRQCTASKPRAYGHYVPRSDRYIDAVQAQHHGAAPGAMEPGICNEWTHSKNFSGRGTACTDISGPEDVPDGLMDRGRIDQIWARWEHSGGRARRFTFDQATRLFARAGADGKTQSPRYSDHRAVRAVVRWCLPNDPCRR